MNKPATTVFCAVWSGDKDRHTLIDQHYENLRRQSTSVDVIYIFDNSDTPPRDLPAKKIACSHPLTIYEAWNLALAACQTPCVMNLNLDDRLCTDAVALLEENLQRENTALIGGDWKICYSQDETNNVGPCYPAMNIPFEPRWPPLHGSQTRLGSGTANRGTFGPATLWRLECHIGAPRYPYRTTKGTKITGISDAIWWDIIKRHLKLKTSRLPVIIGNYYSHPESQAEFRNSHEREMLKDEMVSLV